jgi:hypothetical protein
VPSALATRVTDASGVMPLSGISVKTAPTAVDQSDAFTRYVANHKARTSEPSPVVPAASTGNGFSWGDAGIGAGSAIGLFLLLSLGVMATHRNRKGPLTA